MCQFFSFMPYHKKSWLAIPPPTHLEWIQDLLPPTYLFLWFKMRQLTEPSVSAARRPSAFDPEVLTHHNSPPHWHPSSSIAGEQTSSTSGQRTSFSGPSPFSSLCLSVLAATPQPRMVCFCSWSSASCLVLLLAFPPTTCVPLLLSYST